MSRYYESGEYGGWWGAHGWQDLTKGDELIDDADEQLIALDALERERKGANR